MPVQPVGGACAEPKAVWETRFARRSQGLRIVGARFLGSRLTVERMLIELGHGPEHDRRSGPKRCSVELRRSPVGGAAAAADLADVHAARAVVTALAMPAATGP